jgi:SH3-like domain-containing protein
MRLALLLVLWPTLALAAPAASRPPLSNQPLPIPPVPPGPPAPPAAREAALPRPPPPPRTDQPERPQDAPRGPVTGFPLPRFAATRSDEVNIRTGPGNRYPVEWVLKRRDLPLEIIREHDVWRRVRDWQGTEGWVQTSLLSGRRAFVVVGQEAVLRRRAEGSSDAVARLSVGVIGRIRECAASAQWCEVQVTTPSGTHRGFLPRAAFWGSYRGEPIN